jgi:PAS domain S-box-containing protein
MEAVAERPDGTRIPFIPYPTPLFDGSGRLTGAINMLVDISERKRAEATLEERNAQFELASRIGQIGTYSYNYRTRILHLSPGCAAIYGLPRDTREITQKDWRAQVHPDDLSRIDAVSRQALDHRQPELVLEFRIIRRDGKTRWIESRILVTYNDAGRAVQMIGANIDVTARKQTEQDLAERNVQLALAEKVSRVGSFVNDTQTDTIEFSAGYAAILGFPEGTSRVLRSQWRAIAHPEDVERADEIRRQVFRQKQSEYNIDYRINLPGAGVRWIEARAHVSYDGDGHPRVVGVNIDVTERKRAEDALRRSQAELVDAQRLAHIGSWSWDATTNTFLASHELSRICDWDPTRHLLDERRDHLVDDWEQLSAAAQKAMETGVAYDFDVQSHCNGTSIWVTARGEAVYDSKGQIVGLRGTVQDITERKKTELTLSERNVQLDLAGKAALVGSYAYDADTEFMQISEGYAAIHGFPEGTTELARSECLAGVHLDDLGRVEQRRSEAFQASRREYGVEYRIFRPGGEMRWVETRCFITYDSDGCPHRVVGVSIDITERKRVEEQQGKLVAELDHRVKNVLATVQAVAAHTMQTSASMEHFVAALDGRIRSMGSTHELLSYRRWLGIPLADLVERELAPYTTGSNTEIGGPEVMLSAEAGQTMATVLHELATNAAKHGALSAPSGRVSIRWRLPLNGSADDRLILTWEETGGPLVVSPSKSSYGMHVVRELIPYELGGTVDHVLAPEGARCHFEIPLAQLSGRSSQTMDQRTSLEPPTATGGCGQVEAQLPPVVTTKQG